jgi:hypothetical protein
MKSTFNSRTAIAALIYCIVSLNPAGLYAQNPTPPRNVQVSFAELDQLVAPIALYPDALVAQILVAATYSPQVVEADRFVQHNAGLPPQEVARLADTQRWDPSVKALTAFPSVLANMDRNLEWTTKLGDAYYNQPQDVMGAVQTMRDRAHKSGALHSTPQVNVVYQPGTVVIQPVVPTVVYVPVYNPWIVFGAPVPVYPTYVYAPPVAVAGVAVYGGVGFSAAVFVGFYGSYSWGYAHWGPNWYSHTVCYNQAPYISRSVTVVNHGYYGGWDHSSTAVVYNRQVAYGSSGVASRTVSGSYGTYSRSTTQYAGGNSTTVTGPNGQSASRTVSGLGTGNVTATTTAPNGGTATRSTNYYAGGGSTSVTTSSGAKETTTVTGRGTGSATVTRSGRRGTVSVTRDR